MSASSPSPGERIADFLVRFNHVLRDHELVAEEWRVEPVDITPLGSTDRVYVMGDRSVTLRFHRRSDE